ncbi:hypothetical protein KIL84_000175, partial [Mauremys mutica]
VFQLLTDLKQQRKDSGKHKQSSGQQNLNTIMYETLKYISKTPCRFQSPEIVRDFLKAMKGHKLTKAEKLQLLNHRPMSAVEIQLMVEESEERLTEEQIESLLQTVSSILPGNPEEELQRQATMAAEEEGISPSKNHSRRLDGGEQNPSCSIASATPDVLHLSLGLGQIKHHARNLHRIDFTWCSFKRIICYIKNGKLGLQSHLLNSSRSPEVVASHGQVKRVAHKA